MRSPSRYSGAAWSKRYWRSARSLQTIAPPHDITLYVSLTVLPHAFPLPIFRCILVESLLALCTLSSDEPPRFYALRPPPDCTTPCVPLSVFRCILVESLLALCTLSSDEPPRFYALRPPLIVLPHAFPLLVFRCSLVELLLALCALSPDKPS